MPALRARLVPREGLAKQPDDDARSADRWAAPSPTPRCREQRRVSRASWEGEGCGSCSMPIESGRYCAYCVDERGELQPFETRFARMVDWQGTPLAGQEPRGGRTRDTCFHRTHAGLARSPARTRGGDRRPLRGGAGRPSMTGAWPRTARITPAGRSLSLIQSTAVRYRLRAIATGSSPEALGPIDARPDVTQNCACTMSRAS
jgi:hypothetical protein